MTNINQLKSQLLSSGLQQKNQPLYQVINLLIEGLNDTNNNIASITGSTNSSTTLGQTFLTKNLETGTLPNSLQEIAGSGIQFNDSVHRRVISAITGPSTLIDSFEENYEPPLFVGPIGPTGQAGNTGPMGMSGLDGEDGIDGFSIQGASGKDGINGQSIPGLDGIDGDDGFGIPGIQGIQGLNGRDGINGLLLSNDGEDGLDSFIPGPAGNNGLIGPTGISGMDGIDGDNGLDGFSIPGTPGKIGNIGPLMLASDGEDGMDGFIGPQGIQGPAGPGTVSGTAGTIAKFTASTTLGNSEVTDDGNGNIIATNTVSSNQVQFKVVNDLTSQASILIYGSTVAGSFQGVPKANLSVFRGDGSAIFITNGGQNLPVYVATNGASWDTRTQAGNFAIRKLVDSYNGVSTVGVGVTPVYGGTRLTGQTGAVGPTTLYTTGATDETLLVMANVLVTSVISCTFTVQITYFSEDGNLRTLNLNFTQLGAGTFVGVITNATGTGPYEGVPVCIRAFAGSTIQYLTAGTFTSVTYNVEFSLMRIA